jgi:hypothetical protein
LHVHSVIEDAINNSFADFVIVGAARQDAFGTVAKSLATVALGSVFSVGDVQPNDAFVSDGANASFMDVLANALLAALRARGFVGAIVNLNTLNRGV